MVKSPSKAKLGFIFHNIDIDAEIEQASPQATNKRWYIRLGQKGEIWYRNVVNQARNGKLVPPRCPGIEVMGRRMNTVMMFEDEECDMMEIAATPAAETPMIMLMVMPMMTPMVTSIATPIAMAMNVLQIQVQQNGQSSPFYKSMG
jgi:hypothetical protein